MVNHYEVHANFQDMELFMKSSLNSERSSFHLNALKDNSCDIVQPYKLFKSQHLRYEDSSSLS